MQVQKIDKNHEQLAKIGERTDEIKDLHTRHELTVKRNREVKPISMSAPTGLAATWDTTQETSEAVSIHAWACNIVGGMA